MVPGAWSLEIIDRDKKRTFYVMGVDKNAEELGRWKQVRH